MTSKSFAGKSKNRHKDTLVFGSLEKKPQFLDIVVKLAFAE